MKDYETKNYRTEIRGFLEHEGSLEYNISELDDKKAIIEANYHSKKYPDHPLTAKFNVEINEGKIQEHSLDIINQNNQFSRIIVDEIYHPERNRDFGERVDIDPEDKEAILLQSFKEEFTLEDVYISEDLGEVMKDEMEYVIANKYEYGYKEDIDAEIMRELQKIEAGEYDKPQGKKQKLEMSM